MPHNAWSRPPCSRRIISPTSAGFAKNIAKDVAEKTRLVAMLKTELTAGGPPSCGSDRQRVVQASRWRPGNTCQTIPPTRPNRTEPP